MKSVFVRYFDGLVKEIYPRLFPEGAGWPLLFVVAVPDDTEVQLGWYYKEGDPPEFFSDVERTLKEDVSYEEFARRAVAGNLQMSAEV